MNTLFGAVLGGVGGLLASYLFCPSFLGYKPSVEQWLRDGMDSQYQSTIVICGVVGLLIGGAIGAILDGLAKNKNK